MLRPQQLTARSALGESLYTSVMLRNSAFGGANGSGESNTQSCLLTDRMAARPVELKWPNR